MFARGSPDTPDGATRVLCGARPRHRKNRGVSTVSAHVFSRSPMRYLRSSPSMTRRTGGFTLIEIIVVITIMAIMAALIVPRVVGRTDDARIAAARQDIATLMNALKLYRLDNGRYPTTEQGLRALVEKPTVDP